MVYIDYKQFVDVVKFKIHAISKKLEKEVSNVSELFYRRISHFFQQIGNHSYQCPKCSKGFSMFEVNTLPFTEEGFKCDSCDELLVDDAKKIEKMGSGERYTR